MGILRTYEDGYVLQRNRYNQIELIVMQTHELIKKNMVGYIRDGYFYVLCWENDNYYKVPFARNKLWFDALTSDPEYIAIRELPQIYVITV